MKIALKILHVSNLNLRSNKIRLETKEKNNKNDYLPKQKYTTIKTQ